MTDESLMEAFETGSLIPERFHHREHVRLTWSYLQRYGRHETERRMLAGLRALAQRPGKPDRFDGALTRAWIETIDAARLATSAPTFDALVAVRPELLDRTAVRSVG